MAETPPSNNTKPPAVTEESSSKPKKEKKVPEGLVIPPKKPKLTKAERRALQEQQRAAKAAKLQQQQGSKDQKNTENADVKEKGAVSSSSKAAAQAPAAPPKRPASTTDGSVASFVSHLPAFKRPEEIFQVGATLAAEAKSPTSAQHELHSRVLQLGYQYATGDIRGGNARCLAMLECFDQIIDDYVPPKSSTDIRHSLDQQVFKASFQYWTQHCRHHSVSMGNAFTFLKTVVASMDREVPFDTLRQTLHETIHQYRKERILFADELIANNAQMMIRDDDVILIYGLSQAVVKVLVQAKSKRLRAIVVDSRPLLEGRQALEQLRTLAPSIECTYILLNALTYVLGDVTKVLLGAAALMSDGSVLNRVGSASVALLAHSCQIPVLVCSETYKISNRVQLESLVANELGDPNELRVPGEDEKKEDAAGGKPKLLNLRYDLTPASFVSGIITELGVVPPTSVAVLLREMDATAENR